MVGRCEDVVLPLKPHFSKKDDQKETVVGMGSQRKVARKPRRGADEMFSVHQSGVQPLVCGFGGISGQDCLKVQLLGHGVNLRHHFGRLGLRFWPADEDTRHRINLN